MVVKTVVKMVLSKVIELVDLLAGVMDELMAVHLVALMVASKG